MSWNSLCGPNCNYECNKADVSHVYIHKCILSRSTEPINSSTLEYIEHPCKISGFDISTKSKENKNHMDLKKKKKHIQFITKKMSLMSLMFITKKCH